MGKNPSNDRCLVGAKTCILDLSRESEGGIEVDTISYYIKEIINATGKGLKGYLISAIKLAAISFVLLCIGFLYFGIDFWFLKALGIAVFDLIPILGSGMVMIPWAVIHLLLGNTTLAWQIGLLYIILVVVRQIAEPFITGKELGIRPLYTFLATVVCILLFGPIGAVLGAVVAVVIKAILEVTSVSRNNYDKHRR